MTLKSRLVTFLILFLISTVSLCSFACSSALARKTYKIGALTSSPPFSFVDIKDGKQVIRGHSIDKWVMLSKFLNFDVVFVPVSDHSEAKKIFLEGKIDLLLWGTEKDSLELNSEFLPGTIPIRHHLYVNSASTSVTCQNDLPGKRVVLQAGVPYSPVIEIREDMLTMNSNLEALSLVNRGMADVYIAFSERIADYIIDENNLKEVKKKGLVLGTQRAGYVIPKNMPELIAGIKRANAKFEQEKLLDILNEKWFGRSVIQEKIPRYTTKQIILVITAVVLVFLLIVLWNISLKIKVGKATRELSFTEKRYRSLIESSPDMIFLVDRKGNIIQYNERAATSLNIPILGSSFSLDQIIAPENEEDLRQFIEILFTEGCSRFDFAMITNHKNTMEVEVAGRVIGTMRDDTKRYACLFVRDVTERKRLEEELVQSERLGIIGKMAASVAHEINNPLGIIQANAEDLMFEQVNESVGEGLKAIQRNAVRAGAITKGLLELASPKPVSFELLDMEEIIKGSISLLGPGKNSAEIKVVVEDRPLTVYGDEYSLQQVIVNLLFNSLAHANSSKGIEIHGSRQTIGGEGTVRLIVRDFGLGIARENLMKIFEPFFSQRQGGFGLGLFITRIIVERHGGIIYASSIPGEGTAMNLEFPAYEERQQNA